MNKAIDASGVWPILTMDIRYEQDVVQARQKARQIAAHLHFDLQELTRIATAVSELVRFAFKNGGFNQVTFSLVEKKFRVSVLGEHVPGVSADKWNDQSLSNDARSLGLIGARKLMDEFNITSDDHGVELSLTKSLPLTYPSVNESTLDDLGNNLSDARVQDPYDEIKQQNRELVFALNALKNQQIELEKLNKELAETNQGVLALYAELEDKALSLQKASEAKSLFFSNMTHEFRTPLNSATSLVRMLLDRQDGELTSEQERQVMYIRKSIEDLSQMVNDLLDIAKVESGKITVRNAAFTIPDLFSALRGMFRPLVAEHGQVHLSFQDASHLPNLVSDESKVSQILRNFVSNALKNTDAGDITVSSRLIGEHHLLFSVADTGIGIAPEDQARIFEEFVQLDNFRYANGHGTGLGLPLSKRLATLLGGRIILESEIGQGSIFSLILPLNFHEEGQPSRKKAELPLSINRPRSWLIIDGSEIDRYLLSDLMNKEGYQVLESQHGAEALEMARHKIPSGIFLDGHLLGMDSVEVLSRLRGDPATRSIPVIVAVTTGLPAEQLAEIERLASKVVAKDEAGKDTRFILDVRTVMRDLVN